MTYISCITVAGYDCLPLRPETEKCLSVVWCGYTWNYWDTLRDAKVLFGYINVKSGEGDNLVVQRKYVHALKSMDVTKDVMRIQNILKEVFQNLAMKVIISIKPVGHSDVAELIGELRKIPNLHFEN